MTLYLASLVSGAMCLIPGLPKIAFLLVSSALFIAARKLSASPVAPPPLTDAAVAGEKKKASEAVSSDLANLLRLEDLTLEIGFQLIPLVDEKQGGQLLSRVRSLRRHLSAEMGFLVPPVHISDNLRLKPREYLFSLRGMEIGRWQTEGALLLAVSSDPNRRPLRRQRGARAGLRRAGDLDSAAVGGSGQRRRLLGGGCDDGDYHASGRADPPARS